MGVYAKTTQCGYCSHYVHYREEQRKVVCSHCHTTLISTSAEQHEDHSGETGHAPRGRAKLFKS